MQIKRSGLVYRIAYALDTNKDTNAITQVSLCKLFWRLVGMIFVGYLICLPIALIAVVIVLIISSAVGILFAQRLNTTPGDNRFLQSIERWPSIAGHKIYPIVVILPVVLIWALVAWRHDLVVAFSAVRDVCYTDLDTLIISILCGAVIICLVIFFNSDFWKDCDIWYVTKEYLKAKKAKICPLVDIVDDDKNGDKAQKV